MVVLAQQGPIKLTCQICGNDFYVRKHEVYRRKTCSTKCSGERKRTMYTGENNPNFGNRGHNNPMFKGGVRTSNYGYTLIYKPEHPNARSDGYILEHRYVMSEHLMRPLEDWEVVHHKDENKQNNSIDNLEVMTLSEHQAYHNSLYEIIRGEKGRIVGIKRLEVSTMTLDALKRIIAAFINEEVARGTRKANIEIELIHFIKRELYKD